MPKTHTVKKLGETFCSVAVHHKFANCKQLRAEPDNIKTFDTDRDTHEKWVLKVGDEVVIPKAVPKGEEAAPEKVNKYVRNGLPLAEIRFIRDIAEKPTDDAYRGRPKTTLDISNYVTDKAGADETATLVDHTHHEFNADADKDEDTYKVEVIDPRTKEDALDVHIEALKPKYQGTGMPYVVKTGDWLSKIAKAHGLKRWQDIYNHRLNRDFKRTHRDPDLIFPGDHLFIPKKVTGHEPFPGTAKTATTAGSGERGKRSLPLKVKRVDDTRYFRSCYVRLVVDDVDKAARDKQALLTTDMFDLDSKVEILDQNVWAEYVLDKCPATDHKCRAVRDAAINRGKEADLCIRVLRAVANGKVGQEGGDGNDGIVSLEDVRRRIQIYCRRHWAQAHVRYNIVRLETVDLPSDMLTVGDETGNRSTGHKSGSVDPGKIGFTINVRRFTRGSDATHPIAAFDVPRGKTPQQTAELIRTKVNRINHLSAKVSVNPPEVGNDRGSADVLITDDQGGRITITGATGVGDQDSDQRFSVVHMTSLTVEKRNTLANYHVGHPEERNLFKSYDTGDKVIDLYVVDEIPPDVGGFTVPEQAHLDANRQLMVGMKNSFLIIDGMADGSDDDPFAIPHEIGHILLDNAVHALRRQELMDGNYLGASTTEDDPKRISHRDPAADNWQKIIQNPDGTLAVTLGEVNPVKRIGQASADLLH